ncbi:unnamed protein product [Calypogeia fissa]
MGSANEAGSLFVNDGSFLERFKQLQEQHEASKLSSSSLSMAAERQEQQPTSTSGSHQNQDGNSSVRSPAGNRQQGSPLLSKAGQNSNKPAAGLTNGKLAFSLKQKSRLSANALKLGGEEDEEGEEGGQGDSDRRSSKKQKSDKAGSQSEPGIVAPPDPEVKKVADKLASFVAKNGRQFENITRQKNPGDTPFRFLFDVTSPDYKYYEQRVAQEEQAFQKTDSQSLQGGGSASIPTRHQSNHQRNSSHNQRTNYSTPASALYSGSNEDRRRQREHSQDYARQSSLPTDSVSMMEFYMKKAAQEDLRKPQKQPKDDMPSPAVPLPPETRSSPVMWAPEEAAAENPSGYLSPSKALVDDVAQAAIKKGHHMGDYIPPEELEKFLAKCNDAMAQKAAKATADRAKIQADNVGHRLLSKMGWKEGEGLGSRKAGQADPVQAGAVKLNNLGVGAEQPGEVTPDDDIYEQYKKRMMLGYKFRPNPLNNPRKAYY